MLYEKVAEYCHKKRISIRKLEMECGMANGTIGKWKARVPDIKTMFKLSDTTGISITRLCRWVKEDLDGSVGMDESKSE